MAIDDFSSAVPPSGLEELNRAILESALDCIITMDAAGVVREWNPAAERTFGYSREQTVGRELAELIIPPELRERHRKGLAHYLSTGEGPVIDRRIEITGLHADGRRLLVELAITAIHLAEAPMFTAYLRDITERVRAERRRDAQYAVASQLATARRIEEIGSRVIETIAQSGSWIYGALWLRDPKDDNLRCHSVWHTTAPGLEKFREFSRALVFSGGGSLPGRVVVSGKPTWIFDVKKDSAFPRARAAAEAGLAGAFAFPLRAGEEMKGALELFSAEPGQPDEDLLLLVDSLGSQIGHFIARRQIEAELERQKEVAEAANAAKDRFLATLSHELRTPLTPVLMWAGGMLYDHDLPAELREGLQMIARNIELEARLIDDLLDLTRIARGKLRLQVQKTDIHEVLRHAVEIVREGGCPPDFDLALELGATQNEMSGDPTRLQQVFWNLLRNAIKFTGPGGRVVLRSENRMPDAITIAVSDTGSGIAPENLSKIFDAFEQLSQRKEGLGLGLAISQAIVDLHHGKIRAESAGLGHGATFIVELPTAGAARSS